MQLHSNVMPHMSNPLLLSDFLTSCLDEGGMVGMLALNGIFTLVTKHGLEYPNFYARLYALLQVSANCCDRNQFYCPKLHGMQCLPYLLLLRCAAAGCSHVEHGE